MKIQLSVVALLVGAIIIFPAHAEQSVVISPTGQPFEFTNFIVNQVSSAELTISQQTPPVDTTNPAIRIAPKVLQLLQANPQCAMLGVDNKKIVSTACPPSLLGLARTYRIKIVPETKLSLRTGESALLSQFVAGDHVTARGIFIDDGVVRGTQVKNLTRPIEKNYAQINNLEVVSVVAGNPMSFIVFRRGNEDCKKFPDNKTVLFPCPNGIPSLSDYPLTKDLSIADRIKSYLQTSEKYEIRLTPTTAVTDRNKSAILPATITAGDKLNVYGVFLDANGNAFEAETVRDISLPFMKPTPATYTGVITQINAGDGSFVLRTRDGRLLTAKNPFQADSYVTIKGVLDEKTDIVSELSQIQIRSLTDKDAVPFVGEIRPGSGVIGTRVTIIGSGFTATDNSINFAGIRNVMPNLPSPDGRTISFIVPAFACQGGGQACGSNQLASGTYNFSITNKNGTSDIAKFVISPLPPLQITTDSLPQVVEQDRYSTTIEARGGTDSYGWTITNGSIPPGLQLVQPVCVTSPCRIPVTISGIPTVAGTYNFTAVLQSGGEKASKDFSIVVVKALSRGY